MRWRMRWVLVAALVLFLAGLVPAAGRGVAAAGNQPPGPDRFAVVTQNYTSYEWWLSRWSDNRVVCNLDIDHAGLPTGGDILTICGRDTYDLWKTTPPCPGGEACAGYYLQLVRTRAAQRKVGVKQPPPLVWVTLKGCAPYRSTYRCSSLPSLVFTGEEPIPGEHILSLAGTLGGRSFTCDAVCTVDLLATGDAGVTIQFWANSSYGDSSDVFQARLRVIHSADPADQNWYVDILSDQWRGGTLAGCSQIWDTFPTPGGLPAWLDTPQRASDLATNVPYEYLAASLIQQGLVKASTCEDGGLLPNGLASVCGLEQARPASKTWQNRFDDLIFSAALKTGVPARLLKNIFARESQFWPGASAAHLEAGLGQMTEGGADLVLTWNAPFYEQFCTSVLTPALCRTKIYPQPEDGWEYMGLNDAQRGLLRGALLQEVNAACPTCKLGIDLKKAEASVAVFAQTLVASCRQAGAVIELNSSQAPGEVASYENLWRFTLVNYNAGPGCLGLAVDGTVTVGEPLDWEHLSTHFTPACQGAADYVNAVSGAPPEAAAATETPTPTP